MATAAAFFDALPSPLLPGLEALQGEFEKNSRTLAALDARAAPLFAHLENFRRQFSAEDWDAWARLTVLLEDAQRDTTIRRSAPVAAFIDYLADAIADRPRELIHEGPVSTLREIGDEARRQKAKVASDAAHKGRREEWERCLSAFDATPAGAWRSYAEAARALAKDFAIGIDAIRADLIKARPTAYKRTGGRPPKLRS
jgi:hypothetical protein